MLAILSGLIMLLLGILGLVKWWTLFLKGLEATLPVLLIIAGTIAVVAGIGSRNDAATIKKDEDKKEGGPKAD